MPGLSFGAIKPIKFTEGKNNKFLLGLCMLKHNIHVQPYRSSSRRALGNTPFHHSGLNSLISILMCFKYDSAGILEKIIFDHMRTLI